MPATTSMPPGPRAPATLQILGMAMRQRPYLERQRRRHGSLFTIKALAVGSFVVVCDPAQVKQVFTADPKVLHAGDHSPLRAILGEHSLLGIDEGRHLEQRRLLLPPFKGQRMRGYEGLIEEVAAAEIDRFPIGTPFPVGPFMQRITLRAILRAVFGATGQELHELEELLPPWTEQGSWLSLVVPLQHDLGPRSPWGRFLRLRARIDAVLDRLIRLAREDAELTERGDVLALLVQSTHLDGSPMADAEIRDQLVTMLAAGHETTAHQLSWGVERLSRHPEVLARLVEEVDAGGRTFRDATIKELQRVRSVIPAAGRYTMEPYELGGFRLPQGIHIALAASLTHFDPELFDRPERFDPDRFLHARPDTYSWLPFGGGLRRCIGASFAHMELDVVLRVLLERVRIEPTSAPDERERFRGVAVAPALGGMATVRRRVQSGTPVAPALAAA